MNEGHEAVVWPLGRRSGELTALPARIDGLNGKVVAELWDFLYRGDEVFPVLREELTRRYPDVRFVEYETFGNMHGDDEQEALERLPQLLREHNVDAVIAGVGH
jgi:hypothetical protein